MIPPGLPGPAAQGGWQGWHQLLLTAPQPGQGCWHLPTGQISAESVRTSSSNDDILGMRGEQAGAWGGEMPGLGPLHHPHTLLLRQDRRAQWDKTKKAFPHLASHHARSGTGAKGAVPTESSPLPWHQAEKTVSTGDNQPLH